MVFLVHLGEEAPRFLGRFREILVSEHFDSNVLVDQPNLNLVEISVGISVRRFQLLFQATPDVVVGRIAPERGSPARRYFEPHGREKPGNHVVAVLVDGRIELFFRRLLECFGCGYFRTTAKCLQVSGLG